MKKIDMFKLLTCFLAMFISNSIAAQTASVSNIEVHTENAVFVDSIWHSYKEAEAIFTVDVNLENAIDSIDVNSWETIPKAISGNFKDGFVFSNTYYPEDSTYVVIRYTRYSTESDTTDWIPVSGSITVEVPIKVYDKIETDQGVSSLSIYAGDSIAFEANDDAVGLPGEWIYTWSGDRSGNMKTMKDAPTELRTYTYDLHAEYVYDGQKWDSYDYSYNAIVLPRPKPVASISSLDIKSENAVLADSIWHSYQEAEVIFTVNVDLENVIDSIDSNSWETTPKTFIGNQEEGFKLCGIYHPGDSTHAIIRFTRYLAASDSTVWTPMNDSIIVEVPIRVYNKIETDQGVSSLSIYAGDSIAFEANDDAAGLPGEWVYTWSGDKSGSMKIMEDAPTELRTYTYDLHAEYVYDGQKWDSYDYSYSAIVHSRPKPKHLTIKLSNKDITYYELCEDSTQNIGINCFEGDTIDIAYETEGEDIGYANQWLYRRTDSLSNVIAASNEISYIDSYTATCDEAEHCSKDSFSIELINENGAIDMPIKPQDAFCMKLNLNIVAWKKGCIIDNAIDSISAASWTKQDTVHVYAGGTDANDVRFCVSHNNGYEDGWHYEWFENDQKVSTNESEWIYTPSVQSDFEDKVFQVHITNNIEDNYSVDTTITYYARIWDKVKIDEKISLTDINTSRVDIARIREGNRMVYDVKIAECGFCDEWLYKWNGEGLSYGNEKSDTILMKMMPGTTKQISELEYGLHLFAKGIYGNVWDGKNCEPVKVLVYRRPITPKTITKKGNGTSCTAIVTTDISDQDLVAGEYWLRFGYVDPNGKFVEISREQQTGIGSIRWSRGYSSANINGTLAVCSEWVYPDGVRITSGLRTINDCDEEWDGSDYSNATRGVAELESQTGIESLNNNSEFGNVIYNTNGVKISNYQRGINIVRLPNGTVRKVFIK